MSKDQGERGTIIGAVGLIVSPIGVGIATCLPVVGLAVAAVGATAFVCGMSTGSDQYQCSTRPRLPPLGSSILMVTSIVSAGLLLENIGQMFCWPIDQCYVPTLGQMILIGTVCIVSFLLAARILQCQEENEQAELNAVGAAYRAERAVKAQARVECFDATPIRRASVKALPEPNGIVIPVSVEASEDGVFWFEIKREAEKIV